MADFAKSRLGFFGTTASGASTIGALAIVALTGCAELSAKSETLRIGAREFAVRVTHTGERARKNEALSSVTPEVSVFLADRVSLRAELPIYHLQERPDSFGAGFNVGTRAYLAEYGEVSLFVGGAGGILYSHERFPDRGTMFNFTYYFDAGLRLPVHEAARVDLGFRFQHISNGFIRGRKRNPVSNMFGGFVGVAFPF